MQVIKEKNEVPIKMWTEGVPVEAEALKQLHNVAGMPFVSPHVAVMPDVHYGIGATVGSVIPTSKAIIPAAVGVDIGCGMMAVETTLKAKDLPDSLGGLRSAIERAVPHGFENCEGRYVSGTWETIPASVASRWRGLEQGYKELVDTHGIGKRNPGAQLGTLGGGNHFIELCLDTEQNVWVMLHSGSRGIGNQIGQYFIEKAKEEMRVHFINLPDQDLAYLVEGTQGFSDYVRAMSWAQDYAAENRKAMLESVLRVLHELLPAFTLRSQVINCHHNYVSRENHRGHDLYITRKGAVSAQAGELGIIPGSMGARSFIVRGKGNEESFCSCSHGAGRKMSRSEAKRTFTAKDHEAATAGVECRKDFGVIDETPGAYKDIELVMAAQADLVEVVAELKQVLCVKG
jgi:tRNA-splicing ligase RtcB